MVSWRRAARRLRTKESRDRSCRRRRRRTLGGGRLAASTRSNKMLTTGVNRLVDCRGSRSSLATNPRVDGA